MKKLQDSISKKRDEMILVGMKEGLSAERTVQLSCELDNLMIRYQKTTLL